MIKFCGQKFEETENLCENFFSHIELENKPFWEKFLPKIDLLDSSIYQDLKSFPSKFGGSKCNTQ